MKFVIIQFPGSNCDQDCYRAAQTFSEGEVRYAWHKEREIAPDEVVILPGGFSYGDYLRTGSIARFSPIMESVVQAARRGQPVIGICNGFQILCEAGLLPGALVRNRDLHFICDTVRLRVDNVETPFTSRYQKNEIISIPIAHGEGCYVAEPEVIETLEKDGRVVFRYVDEEGNPTEEANPNGSIANIAGICNEQKNVLGMMPHPERACEMLLNNEDGRAVFESFLERK